MFNKGFTHPHLHSQYLLLDGMIRSDELLERCKGLDMESVAIEDNVVFVKDRVDCRREKSNIFADEPIALDSFGTNQESKDMATEIKTSGE